MAEIDEVQKINRRRFLRRMAIFSGLVATGGLGLTACGDTPTATSAPAPTNTVALTNTAILATPTVVAKAPATPATNPTKPAATTPANTKPDPGFADVGPVSDFAGTDTEPKLIDMPRSKKPAKVFVVKQGDTYTALSNICTHQGCEVDWVAEDKLFECPCHGSQYDLDGTNVGGPAPLPLASYSMKVQNGRLLISVKNRG